MFLKLAHTKLEVYQASRGFVLECYRITKEFPADERYTMIRQIRRAALSAHLNLAEGCSRKSQAERSRYFEISRGSVIEVDTCFDVAIALEYVSAETLRPIEGPLAKVFKLLCGMIQ